MQEAKARSRIWEAGTEAIKMGKKKRRKPLILPYAAFFAISLITLPAKAYGIGEITGTVKARGVKNPSDVVVYIGTVESRFQPPEMPLVIDVKMMSFVPHVLPLLVGSSVKFANHDQMEHHAMALQNKKTIFDLPLPTGASSPQVLNEVGPVTILDAHHPEMSAYIVVLQNSFFAKPDEKGNYLIQNIPPGTYILKTWHEKLKPQSKAVKVLEGSKIRVDFELRP